MRAVANVQRLFLPVTFDARHVGRIAAARMIRASRNVACGRILLNEISAVKREPCRLSK